MLFEYCPRCNAKNWSSFQTGNVQNEVHYFSKYCNACHNFSFSYNCSIDNINESLDRYSITANQFTVYVNLVDNTTVVSMLNTHDIVFLINIALNIDVYAKAKDISYRIQKLILFS